MKVKAFKAIRPNEKVAAKVSSLPYDVYSEKEARDIVNANPDSFLKIVRSETAFPVGTDPMSPQIYEKAKQLIQENIDNGVFEIEENDCYFIYRQIMNGRAQTGLVACFSVDDCNSGVIKRHEFTRKDKELDRTTHIDVCSAQTGLIFLAFGEGQKARDVLKKYTEGEPLYDFTAIDGVRQIVWKVSESEDVKAVADAFGDVNCMYIADGHHRTASSASVCAKRREENPGFTGDEDFNFFMAVAFPSEELQILPYYRAVTDLGELSEAEFMNKISEKFDVQQIKPVGCEPETSGQVYMLLEGKWYLLSAHQDILKDDAIGSLDVSMLQENILGPILGIEDPRSDKRIDFIGGIRGLAELEKRCSEDMKVAFALHHTSVEQLMRIADEGMVMPPKSTWFEPKLQSGLFVHRF